MREDRWGGGAAERAGFAAALVRAIRSATGPDFPIIFRFSQWKLQDYDARNADTPGELEDMLAPLVAAGIDVFDARTRIFTTTAFEGADMGLAGRFRTLTGTTPITVGGEGLSNDRQTSL